MQQSLTLWRPLLPYGWASECPDVKNYKWRLNPIWHHRMLYSCTHMATVGVKRLNKANSRRIATRNLSRSCRSRSCSLTSKSCFLDSSPLRAATSACRDSRLAGGSITESDDVIRPLVVTQWPAPLSGDELDSIKYFPTLHTEEVITITNSQPLQTGTRHAMR